MAAVSSVEAALKEAEAHLKQKKICTDCYNEEISEDSFCAECGGALLACGDSDEEPEEERVTPASKAPAPVVAAAPVVVAVAASKPAPVAVVAPAAASAAALPSFSSVFPEPPDAGYAENVFVIDLGTEYSRFGFSKDPDCLKIRSCVDGRANVRSNNWVDLFGVLKNSFQIQHNFLQIRGQV